MSDDGGPLFKSDVDPAPPLRGSGTAIAGFVLGILSVILLFIPFNVIISGLISLSGVILSWIGRRSARSGLANAGLLLSGIALLLMIVTYVCLLSSMLGKHH